jgi:hypothetical protein
MRVCLFVVTAVMCGQESCVLPVVMDCFICKFKEAVSSDLLSLLKQKRAENAV